MDGETSEGGFADYQDWGHSVMEGFPILPKHKIPQMLPLTIYGSGYAGGWTPAPYQVRGDDLAPE